jgi:hypothetical protein
MEHGQKEIKLMKGWQYLLSGIVLIALVIQLVPSELPSTEINNPGDLIESGIVSIEVAGLLRTSCYDCHSNETKFPWYSYVAPFSWLVAKDVKDARKELNFSVWQDYDMMEKLEKLDDISIEVKEGEMPMPIYTAIHTSAKLSDAQRQLIVQWAEDAMDSVVEEDEESGPEEG